MVNSSIVSNKNLKEIASMGSFHVLEHERDMSVSAYSAVEHYFASKMNVRKRQLMLDFDNSSYIVQAGAMQWMSGEIETNSNVKGVGDFLGKMASAAVTKESAVKPIYQGRGRMMLEPTYRYIILLDVSEWGGIVLDDGLFLACESSLKQKTVARKNLSSAVLGGEGLFNLSLNGNGIAALESYVPYEELIEVVLDNDVMKIDGNMAVAWSDTLEFTVEKSGKSLLGSAVSGEGFVNVYRGSGRILLAPTINDWKANPADSSSAKAESQSKTSSTGKMDKAGKALGTLSDVLDIFG